MEGSQSDGDRMCRCNQWKLESDRNLNTIHSHPADQSASSLDMLKQHLSKAASVAVFNNVRQTHTRQLLTKICRWPNLLSLWVLVKLRSCSLRTGTKNDWRETRGEKNAYILLPTYSFRICIQFLLRPFSKCFKACCSHQYLVWSLWSLVSHLTFVLMSIVGSCAHAAGRIIRNTEIQTKHGKNFCILRLFQVPEKSTSEPCSNYISE